MCKKKILFEVPPTRDDVENKITIKPVEFGEIKILPFAFLLIFYSFLSLLMNCGVKRERSKILHFGF